MSGIHRVFTNILNFFSWEYLLYSSFMNSKKLIPGDLKLVLILVYLPIVLKMQCETHLLTKTSFDLSIFKYLKIDAML